MFFPHLCEFEFFAVVFRYTSNYRRDNVQLSSINGVQLISETNVTKNDVSSNNVETQIKSRTYADDAYCKNFKRLSNINEQLFNQL